MPLSDIDVVLVCFEQLLKDGLIDMSQLNMDQLTIVLALVRALNNIAEDRTPVTDREP